MDAKARQRGPSHARRGADSVRSLRDGKYGAFVRTIDS